MSMPEPGIYAGEVVHARVRPTRHALRYNVFTLFVDVANREALANRTRLFSTNRFNLVSLHDKDFGDGKGLDAYLRELAVDAGMGESVRRFFMLCYPRVLSYVFNPLTVYFGLDAQGDVVLTIYEVTNTFGERKTYVIPAAPDATGHIWQQCPKQFFVSPFNAVSGSYSFHVSPLAETLTLGVALKDGGAAVMRAHFRGTRQALTDANLFGSVLRSGLLTFKVIAAIHYQAARLWLKGLRVKRKPPPPANPVTFFRDARSGIARRSGV